MPEKVRYSQVIEKHRPPASAFKDIATLRRTAPEVADAAERDAERRHMKLDDVLKMGADYVNAKRPPKDNHHDLIEDHAQDDDTEERQP